PLLFKNGAHQRDGQAGIIELSIIIADSAPKSFFPECRNLPDCFGNAESPGAAKVVRSGEQVVDFQPGRVEGLFPPSVARDDKGLFTDDMRCIPGEQLPFMERIEDQRDIPLLEVADPSVDQFRAPAGGSLAEIMLLDQKGLVASGGGIECGAQSGRPASDDKNIPGSLLLPDGF